MFFMDKREISTINDPTLQSSPSGRLDTSRRGDAEGTLIDTNVLIVIIFCQHAWYQCLVQCKPDDWHFLSPGQVLS